jgi:leucyl-tRNA synthetase
MKDYNHKEIENNWRDKWFNDNLYEAVDFSPKPKKYILAELPYPSGKFLHVGHMMRYTVPEIYARFSRMRGYNVLFPMGWDCFGLPAETFAQKEGITPQEAIAKATKDYKQAMMNMGYSIDWKREINTSDPKYYKWTQLMFKRLWEHGYAIQKEMPVWWCRELGVLADEEVLPAADGIGKISERGGYPVEKKTFKQWVLDIPRMADRLISDLNKVDYEDSVKAAQINWIGRKEGAEVDFYIKEEKVTVFTTRPDTLFGVTFLALSPEHPSISKLLESVKNRAQVEEYINLAKGLSDIEKQTKEKTGVRLDGVFAKHPLEEVTKEITVFVADYILSDFGTGAIMGVPAHDERDLAFAQKYNVEVIKVVDTEVLDANGPMINSGEYNGMSSTDFYTKIIGVLEKSGKGKKSKMYKLRPQVFSRQRYWGEPIPLIYKKDGAIEALQDDSLPLTLPVMKDFLAGQDGVSPLAKNSEWNTTVDSKGNPAKRETDTMPTWAGSNWYYMRYVDPKNEQAPADPEKVKYWMPVDKYFGDSGHTTAHLLYSRFWFKFLYDIGIVPIDEPYMYRMSGGMLLGADNQKMSKSRGNVINPKDVLDEHGADAVRTYLAFIGPYDATYPWNPRSMNACSKLTRNIFALKEKVTNEAPKPETTKLLHKLIKNSTSMFEGLRMNTAVSEIMIFYNHLKNLDYVSQDTWREFIKVIAPIMPFLAEELWQELNNFTEWHKENSVHVQNWPVFDNKILEEDTIRIPVQINGKVRFTIELNKDSTEDEARKVVEESPSYAKYVNANDIKNFLYIKNKVCSVNF